MRFAVRLAILALAAVLGSSFPNDGWCEGALAIPGGDTGARPTALSFSAGGAWTDLALFGSVRNAPGHVAIASLELRRTLKVTDRFALDYLAGIVPVELQTGIVVDDSPGARETDFGRAAVYGAGIDPVGIGLRLGRGEWRPFATLRGGVRVFQRPVPDPRSSRFNFVADLGLGILRRVGPSSWVSMSVDLHHVSNGGLADSNRGINQLVLNLGFVRAR
jgi:hypothetical protein